jgi:hypothetical protein
MGRKRIAWFDWLFEEITAGSGEYIPHVKLSEDSSIAIEVGDIQIGAVELKNAATDDRAKVAATSSIAEGDIGVAVQAPVLGATSDDAVDTDTTGTVSGKLRGLVKLMVNFLSRLPASLGASGGLKVEGVTGGVAQPVSLATAPALVASTANIGKVDVPTATSVTYNITCTVADTEYSQALDANCRGFEFQARTEATLRWADVIGKVAAPTAPYRTLKAGDYYASPQLNQLAAPSTLYFASPTAGTVVELIVWI